MYKLLFVIIALFLIMLAVSNCKVTEGFADTTVPITSANIDEYVYKVYKADVKAIQNLADIAMKLQAGGVTVPGTMTIQNQLNVTNATILSNTLEVKGVTNLDSTLAVTGAATINGNITGPTITDLYKQITDLQAKCIALETTITNTNNTLTANKISWNDLISIRSPSYEGIFTGKGSGYMSICGGNGGCGDYLSIAKYDGQGNGQSTINNNFRIEKAMVA